MFGASYKTKLTLDASNKPTAIASTEAVNITTGLLGRTFNFDESVVYTGMVETIGRVVDFTIGGVVDRRVTTGEFGIPFRKVA